MANKKRVRLNSIQTAAFTAMRCWITKPDGKFNPEKPDYKTTLVMDPKSAEALKAEILEKAKGPAEEQGYKKLLRQIADGSVKLPFKDGDEENQDRKDKDKDTIDEIAGMVLVTFKTKWAPRLFIPRAVQEAYAAQKRDVWIMSGDVIKVKADVNPYDGLGGGISLRLKAVKLVEKMAGFESDSGFGDDDDDEYVMAEPTQESDADDSDDDDDDEDY